MKLALGLLLSIGLVVPYSASAVDPATSDEIAERLAGAIRFETISPEDPADFEGARYDDLSAYLRASYPRTHAALELERVNTYSLLYRWQGSNPDLQPALFMSHLDVVPVEDAALAAWTHPPFAGVIEDGYVWGRGAIDVKSGVILWLERKDSNRSARSIFPLVTTRRSEDSGATRRWPHSSRSGAFGWRSSSTKVASSSMNSKCCPGSRPGSS